MKNKNYWHALLAVLLLSACDNSDGIIPPFDEKPITVTADVVQYSRAGYQSDVLLPEKFVMDITQNGEDKFNYSLVEMTRDEGKTTYSAPAGRELLWADNTHEATVKAMTIPMELTTVDGTNAMVVNVSLAQNVEKNVAASDLLGATSSSGGITIDGANINIKFQHLLSKLDVTYSFASEVEGNSVKVNSITLQNICTTGKFSYANMTLVAESLGYDDVAMFQSGTGREGSAEAIFYPYKPIANPTLVINATIDGENCNFSCPVVPKDATYGFIGGKRYTMTVTIVGTSVSGTEATIENGWDKGGEKDFVTE